MRRHHHGRGARARRPAARREQRRRRADPRGGDRQDRGRTAHQADDARPFRKGSRGADRQRIFEIIGETVS